MRLREMRIVRGVSLEQLANALRVTKQAVSKYEHGKSTPASDAIRKMSALLKMPQKYLLKKNVEFDNVCSTLFFRSTSSTKKRHKEYANIIGLWGYEIIREIDNLRRVDLSTDKELSIPEKAIELRRQWGIGTLPIKNLIDVLERHGFYIFTIDSADMETDAYSRIINGVPIIVINKHKGTSVRRRFSLAHELGHLVLHKDLQDREFRDRSNMFEQEANLFAEHFLMPSDSFENSIISPKLDHFVQMKEEWGVSIAAMIYHCGQLGVINSRKVRSLQVQMSALGWKKTEPLDNKMEFEIPHKVSNLILDKITDEDAFVNFYNKVCLPLDEMERICSLREGALTKYGTNEFGRQNTKGLEQLTLSDFAGVYIAQ